MAMESFNLIWQRIIACQGQQFKTVKGLPFTYKVKGHVVSVSRTKQNLPRSDFAKAYALMPLTGPGQINSTVRGPAYIYAILTDSRISESERT